MITLISLQGDFCATAGVLWRKQRRNVFESLTEACDAALRGDAAPPLLPANDQQLHAAA
jgi:UTP:GlnB (protein PII) uridylyltransferase